MEQEFINAGLKYDKEKKIDIEYKKSQVDSAFRADFIVENKIIVELKSVSTVSDIFTAQLLTYMKLSGISIGLLLNFNVKRLKDGIKRYVL